jgi:hypothetical protein
MIIEAGKYYRTQSGCRAYVACVRDDMEIPYPAFGYVEGDSVPYIWDMRGAGSGFVDYDLVSEWVEPVKVYILKGTIDGTLAVDREDLSKEYPKTWTCVGSGYLEPGKFVD